MDNQIVLENLKPGVPQSVWNAPISNQIEGFATQFSVDHGSAVSFKVNLNEPAGATAPYHIEIYRLGYYGGDGATLVTTLTGLRGVAQPNPVSDPRGLVDAGNWSVSASWATPADAVSGVYLAKLVRDDNGATNQIPFVVRDDHGASDIVLQTSDTTWQAYNGWAGNNGKVGANLYGGFTGVHDLGADAAPSGQDRSFAVSYNRPFITEEGGGTFAGAQDYLFGADYAAIYWLEKNGYSVSYISGVDTDRLGIGGLTNHKAFISVGHDEYWSGDQRANVEAARDAGVNLLFWSGNEVYWKTRWETSIVDGAPFRTLVTYKETKDNYSLTAGPHDYANIDPSNQWTGTWRDVRFVDAVAADGVTHTAIGARPENSLTGQLFVADGTGQFGGALNVPAADATLRVWRDTGVGPGGALNIAPGLLGYEWDASPTDAARPPGLIKLSETTLAWGQVLTDQGNRTEPGTATHSLSLYRAPSGALVFGAGTVFWSWGLSNEHDSAPYDAQIQTRALQQFSVNLFADMGIQPGVSDLILQSQGLIRALASSDHVAATATLNTLPANVAAFTPVTISGTSTDDDHNAATVDGRVALVEVSVDNGAHWSPAQGLANWSFSWTPAAEGAYPILVRAIDDSLNLPGNSQLASALVTVSAPPPPSAFSLFGPAVIPTGQLSNDGLPLELGMRFTAARAGSVTALRYYRAPGDSSDTDLREGHLWSADGGLLATVNFVSAPGESGWQVATLTTPVSLTPGVTYLVSYHTADNYFAVGGFFTTGFSDPFSVLNAPASTAVAGNGLYVYGAGVQFPTQTYQGANYWADVVFAPGGGVNHPPTITSNPTFQAPENSLVAGVVKAADADSDPLTYAITGGADAALFTIDPSTGELRFRSAPDFEAPQDAGSDNAYNLTVSVSDHSAAVQQAVTVVVTDLPESPLGPATFAGRTVTVEYIFGADTSTLFPAAGARQTALVSGVAGSVEFPNLPAPDPAALGNGQFGLASVDLLDQTITVQFPLDPAVFGQTFVPFASALAKPDNGVRVSDADGLLPAIRGITILSQRGFTDANGVSTPLKPSDFTVTADGIFLNMAGKGRWVDADPATAGVQPTQVVIGVDLNDAPVLQPDSFSAPSGSTLLIPTATLLAGDTDAEGDRLSVLAVRNASHGVAALDLASGVVSFTADAGFVGVAHFDYVVSDGFGGTATATVTVTLGGGSGNAPPAAPPIDGGVTDEDAAVLSFDLLSTAHDPEGDPLTVQNLTWSSSNPGRTVGASLSAGGALQLDPAQFNDLARGASETLTARYLVSDGVNPGVPTSLTLTVQGRNDGPTAGADGFSTGEGSVLTGNVITNAAGRDRDPDGDPLVIVAVNGAAGGVGAALTLPSGARLTLGPDGQFSYDPNGAFDGLVSGQHATDTFSYTVSDGLLLDTTTVTMTIDGAGGAGLVLTGSSAADSLTGAAGDDLLRGLAGADTLAGGGGRDTLDGGSGADRLDGGAGDDLLQIRAAEAQFDTIAGGAGQDILRVDPTGGVVTLDSTTTLSGIETFDAAGQGVRGNTGANLLDFSGFGTVIGLVSLSGLGGNDTLIGSAGADLLDGGTGSDSLMGGLGADVLIGGAGSDTMTGGAGDDVFRFAAFSDSSASARDLILDFVGAGVAGGDLIDVSGLVTGAFLFNGTGAFSGGGAPSIRYVVANGETDLMFDSGNGGAAEMVIRVSGVMSFNAGDFLL